MTGTPQPRKLSREFTRIGQVLSGRYRLEQVLGKGGMAVVYKAVHLENQQTVAVKMILPHVQDDEDMLSRFQREAKSASKVSHENIVELIDYGSSDDGLLYLVLEFVDGQSLADILKRNGQMGVARSVEIFAQICDAMTAAHDKGLVHRDLKPSNIMVVQKDTEDFVKIVDFGLAKLVHGSATQSLTQTGDVLGSPIYMSPEQCRGLQLDGRADVYSLGIVMYEVLTGSPPFKADNVVATITKQLHNTPEPFKQVRPDLYIPEKLEAVVLKALAKDPGERYQSMAQLKEALLMSLPGRTVMSSHRRQDKKRPAVVSIVVAIAAVAVIAIGIIAATMLLASKHPPPAVTPVSAVSPSADAKSEAQENSSTEVVPVNDVKPKEKAPENPLPRAENKRSSPGTRSVIKQTSRKKDTPVVSQPNHATNATFPGPENKQQKRAIRTGEVHISPVTGRKTRSRSWHDFKDETEGDSTGYVWTPAVHGGLSASSSSSD